jgi:phosphoserine aminotransferase
VSVQKKVRAQKIFNFASGPAVLPQPVLQQAQAELLDWQGRGYSVMETSHRAPEFVEVMQATEALLRELLHVPANYRVLFMQGGGHQQFAMVPVNLLGAKFQADYIVTGHWTKAAADEARRLCNVSEAANTFPACRLVPAQSELKLDAEAAYAYYCPNETIHGVEFDYVPDTGRVPLVADMSSSFLSRPVDIERHGIVYACAQKNFGPAGLTAVVIRDDLIGHASSRWPTVLDYKVYADAQSMWNTPATFSVYVALLVLRWLKAQGGVEAIERVNMDKARLLYETIDGSGGFYVNHVNPPHRSRMNVPFSLRDESLNEAFLSQAAERGLVQLKGHRSVGGMRASIYNAMPMAGVQALAQFMREFAQRQA